jgi:hypothetical protein
MSDEIQLTISRNDLGQIAEGLEARREPWKQTARFLNEGECDGIIEECTDEREALDIVETYDRILAILWECLKDQP